MPPTDIERVLRDLSVSVEALKEHLPERHSIVDRLESALEAAREPCGVYFVGAFSAGKSTLINTLCGEGVCEVGVKPTTSDLVKIPYSKAAISTVLFDSPGIDAPQFSHHKEKSLRAARRADVTVLVVPWNKPIGDADLPLLKEVLSRKGEVVVAVNTFDVPLDPEQRAQSKTEVVAKMNEFLEGLSEPRIFFVAAKTGKEEFSEFERYLNGTLLQPKRRHGKKSQLLLNALLEGEDSLRQEFSKANKVLDDQHRPTFDRIQCDSARLRKEIAELERETEKLETKMEKAKERYYDCKLRSAAGIDPSKVLKDAGASSGIGVGVGKFLDMAGAGGAGMVLGGVSGAVVGGVSGVFQQMSIRKQADMLANSERKKQEQLGETHGKTEERLQKVHQEFSAKEQEERSIRKKVEDIKRGRDSALEKIVETKRLAQQQIQRSQPQGRLSSL